MRSNSAGFKIKIFRTCGKGRPRRVKQKEMKLEVGKTYKTRDGQKIKITHDDGNPLFPLLGEDEKGWYSYWMPDGMYSRRGPHDYDLIKEVTPTPTNPS